MDSSLEQNIARVQKLQHGYQPNNEVASALLDKSLVMIVAPPAIGKTTVMKRAAELNKDFGQTSVFTTREQRADDDPSLIRTVPNTPEGTALILQKIIKRELVQFAVHPTQHTIYGTEAYDYPFRSNLLATLSGAVQPLRSLPFKQTTTIGLLAEPSTYKKWFLQRYPKDGNERRKRASEAILSLTWLLEQPDHEIIWLINQDSGLDETAAQLITYTSADTSKNSEQARLLAERCITMAQTFA